MKEHFKTINSKELRELRRKMYEDQKGICPILNKQFPESDMVVDHKHRRGNQEIGENGAGCIRGVIQRQANVLEGKFINAFYRYGLHKITDPVTFLRRLADYLEKGTTNIIHPSESRQERKKGIKRLKKSSFGKMLKLLSETNYKGKVPEYPRYGRMTVLLFKLFKKVQLQPEYYKD